MSAGSQGQAPEGLPGLYLYGLFRGSGPDLERALFEVKGATNGAPELRDLGIAAIIAGGHDGSEILQTRRRMLAHTRVLETAMAYGTVLPMRFGLVAEDMATLSAMLASHAEAIAARFDHLAGQVELGLRVSVPRAAALDAVLAAEPALAAARDRLMGRGAEGHFDRIELGRAVAEALERRRTRAQSALIRELAGAVTDHVLRAPEDDCELLRAECLVPAGAADDLAATVERAAAALDFAPGAEPAIRLVGPVPAFHFVDLALAPSAGREAA
ncbi:MAG: GvpL/GvpF family gas vesicle protein [Pseudomonadota bacterium]